MTNRPPLTLVILPLLTLLSLAFSMAPSDGRLVYARIWGGPPTTELSLRVEVVEEIDGLGRGLADAPLTVSAESPRGRSERSVRTAAGGTADVMLPLPGDGLPRPEHATVSEPWALEVRSAAPKGAPAYARGRIAVPRSTWLGGAQQVSALAAAEASAELPIQVRFEPPVLSVPFTSEVVLELVRSAPAPVEVELEAQGARIVGPARVRLLPHELTRVTLVPEQHTATLTLLGPARSSGSSKADAPGTAPPLGPASVARAARSITLPIAPGSLTARADGDDLIISSPVPRQRAYYSVVTRAGRLGGGVVFLGPRADGTAAGRLARGALPTGRDRYLVLSSSADGQAPSLVGLPLDGQGDAFAPRELLLLDGRQVALRQSQARNARLRWALASYGGLGAILSLALFAWHIRRANERLGEDLARVGVPLARQRSLFGPASALLSLLFAFGLAVTWILVR